MADSDLADALLMSTAVPAVSQTSGVEFSPRQQGAGLADVYSAIKSGAYITVDGGKPKAELGDDPARSGQFTFSFTIHNTTVFDTKTYNLSASLLTEDVDPTYASMGLFFMAGYDCPLDGTVTFDVGDSITVAPNSSETVTATVTLSDYGMAWLDYYYPNGGFVEGFVYLDCEKGIDMSLPYMGYYGDWTDPDVFDTAFWYDNSFWGLAPTDWYVDGNQYFHVVWTSLGGQNWVLGMNPYTGALADRNGNIIYDPANNVVSPNGDGVLDGFMDMYISLMRNAKELWFTYTDANTGEVYYGRDSFGGDNYAVNASKTMFFSGYQQVVPFIHSWYWYDCYDFTDAQGNYLPNGTELILTVSAKLDYEGAPEETIEIPVTVDTAAPELLGAQSVSQNGANYLLLTVSENVSLAYVALLSPNGATVLADAYTFYENEDGTYTVVLDVTGFGNELMVALCDYGCNEGYYAVEYTGENTPEVDRSELFGYRVYDASIYDDSLYGWVTVDKETAELERVTNDMYEYYSLTAAEYVDGYIFAVDAGYNLIIVEPGTFFRTKTICNLGMNVYDMTWDEATNTMFLSGNATDEYGDTYYYFSTLDLLTGELTHITEGYSRSQVPWAMAATEDGTIYAIKCSDYYAYLYTVDKETGAMTAVTDAEGENLVLKRSNGSKASAYYTQSMTYSAEDGVIYWTFFNSSKAAELFTITPATEDTAVSYQSVKFPVNAEIVGLVSLDEDEDYSIPESDALSILVLDVEDMSLPVGAQAAITASCLPWNYELVNPVEWTSSDESVAVVDENGVVTALSKGTATITAECEGVSATCTVTVLAPAGTVYGYNYYSYGSEGDWFQLSVDDMTYTSLTASPVDFISADYNGHEGVIYGYDENGNFYRYDMFTGECETLGKSSILPFDMAYDYSTGFMYGFDGNGNLYRVNMGSGELSLIGGIVNEYGNSSYFIALACSTDGDLYAVDYMGDLYLIDPENIIPGYDWMTGAEVNYVMGSVVMSGLPQCQLLQSMCYEHNEGGIVWPCADYGTLVYIDPEVGGWVALGDYTGTNYVFEHVGMFSVPEDMPELSYVPVESVSAEDLAVFTGHSKAIPVSIMPLNATAQDLDWVSADTSVATVANGVVTGVSKGTTTLTGTLTDGENEFEVSVTVTVLEVADNVHAYLVSDLATYSGYCWIDIDVAQPSTGTSFIANNNYTMYSAEYVDGTGLVYGYGYDDTDWSANKQFMVFDAETYDLVSLTDMGDGFPFVYDMAYDYTTGTMYALASYNDSSSDLYMVNLDSGALIPAQTLERTYQSLVVDGEGTVLGISDGMMEYDWWTGETTVVSSYLVELDPTAGTETELFDLGMMSNMFASAAYDYDTGNIYWARFAQTTAYESGLCVIDVAGETCYDMGVINAAGAQVTGMHIICDEYPESPEGLMDVVMTSELELMGIGDTVELGVFIQPADCQVETEWYSSDPTVATVDENGVVTGVSNGVAYISVTVSDGTTTVTVTCKVVVFGEDDYLISYNRTDNGFSSIDRIDPTAVGNLTEGSSETDVSAMTQVDGVIYGYDENGNFFIIEDLETFQRETVGEHGVTLLESEEYICSFVVRDMAWDEANQRMLVLGCHWLEDEWGYGYEAVGGCRIYEADLTTGELTELVVLTSTYDYYSNAYTMTVDGEGTVYTYSTFIDYFGTVDMETGLVTETTTLQNQSLYGDSDGAPMAMAYDPVTETIYVVWTSNGSFYRLINFDPATGQAVLLGNIGEVIYDEDTWSNNGDLFAGLIIKEMHVHEYVEYTDNGDGTHTKSCECGNEVTEEHHDVEYTDNGDGTHTGSCICGAEFVEDHDYGYSDNGDGTHTGSCQCGSEFTEEHDYEDGQCVCGSEEPGNERPSRPIFPDVPGIIVPSDPTEPEQPEEPSEPEEPGETVELPFTDVDQDDWFYDEVSYAYENGLMNGVSDTLFAPGMDTTRGMIVTILYRLEGAPQVDGDSQFADVADGQWYTDAVIWAAANGIVTGYGDGNFGPLNTITREQLAAIMYRYASYKGYDVSASANLSVYTDADLISAYAVDAMSWANAVGLINGRTATTLVPQGLANRAESATILMRFCEMFAQ